MSSKLPFDEIVKQVLLTGLILSINICERGAICWDENLNLEY